MGNALKGLATVATGGLSDLATGGNPIKSIGNVARNPLSSITGVPLGGGRKRKGRISPGQQPGMGLEQGGPGGLVSQIIGNAGGGVSKAMPGGAMPNLGMATQAGGAFQAPRPNMQQMQRLNPPEVPTRKLY